MNRSEVCESCAKQSARMGWEGSASGLNVGIGANGRSYGELPSETLLMTLDRSDEGGLLSRLRAWLGRFRALLGNTVRAWLVWCQLILPLPKAEQLRADVLEDLREDRLPNHQLGRLVLSVQYSAEGVLLPQHVATGFSEIWRHFLVLKTECGDRLKRRIVILGGVLGSDAGGRSSCRSMGIRGWSG